MTLFLLNKTKDVNSALLSTSIKYFQLSQRHFPISSGMALLYPENNIEHQELFGSRNPSIKSEFCNWKLMCIVLHMYTNRGEKGRGQ
jgi:hypothetical protein